MTKGYIAAVLTPTSVAQARSHFAGDYSKFIGHHVTLQFGVDESTPLPQIDDIQVMGYIDDGEGLEALIVAVDGSIERADDSYYHVTWSLEPHRKPVESNKVIKRFMSGETLSDNALAYIMNESLLPLEFEVKFIPF